VTEYKKRDLSAEEPAAADSVAATGLAVRDPTDLTDPIAIARDTSTDSQSCICRESVAKQVAYTVLIRVPFNQRVCDDTATDLEQSSVQAWSVYCWVGQGGMTEMNFLSHYCRQDQINTLLENHYPTVNGFNCPGIPLSSHLMSISSC
jgi:hypothetical protein